MAQVSSELLRLIDQILDNDASITAATKSYYKRAYIAKAQTTAGQMEIRQIAARVLQPGAMQGVQGQPSGEGGGESGEEPMPLSPRTMMAPPALGEGYGPPVQIPTSMGALEKKYVRPTTPEQQRQATITSEWEQRSGVQASRGIEPTPPPGAQTQGQKTGVIAKLIRAEKYDEAQELLDTWAETEDFTMNPGAKDSIDFLQDSLDAARKRTNGAGGAGGAGGGYSTPQWRPGELELQQEDMKFRREQERNTILDRMQQLQRDIAQMRLTAAQNAVPPGMTSVPGTEPGGFLANNPYHRGGQVPLVSTPWEPPPVPTYEQLGGY